MYYRLAAPFLLLMFCVLTVLLYPEVKIQGLAVALMIIVGRVGWVRLTEYAHLMQILRTHGKTAWGKDMCAPFFFYNEVLSTKLSAGQRRVVYAVLSDYLGWTLAMSIKVKMRFPTRWALAKIYYNELPKMYYRHADGIFRRYFIPHW